MLAHIELASCRLSAHDNAIAHAIRLEPKNAAFYLRAAVAAPPIFSISTEIAQNRQRIEKRLTHLLQIDSLQPIRDPLKEMPGQHFTGLIMGRRTNA